MEIDKIQEKLGLPVTGIFDELTAAAVRNYQLKNGLVASGILDQETYRTIIPAGDGILDSDLLPRALEPIQKKYLDKNEYLLHKKGESKRYIFLHHTAGWNNPYSVISGWNDDSRGPVGTQYVIGGIDIRTGDSRYDGEIVECMPDYAYAWHLTIGDTIVHRESVGIEICNFGWLNKDWKYEDWRTQKGRIPAKGFYTYTNTKVDPKYVVDLGYEFRGYRYYHAYTDAQIESTRQLIKMLSKKHNIDISKGLKSRLLLNKNPQTAFEYSVDIRFGRESNTGVYAHTNVIQSGKWDVSPQPKLIEMLKNL